MNKNKVHLDRPLVKTIIKEMLRLLYSGGVSWEKVEEAQHKLKAMRENSGATEELVHGGEHDQETFQIIAECVAVMAFIPGGITFCGVHYEEVNEKEASFFARH